MGGGVGIGGVGAGEEGVGGGVVGRRAFTEAGGAELVVADEGDAAHAGYRPLVDLEHEIDTVLLERDDLRIDRGGKAAVAAGDVEGGFDGALHLWARVDDARRLVETGVRRVGSG